MSARHTRRNFLGRAAALAVLGAAGARCGDAVAAIEPIKRMGGPFLRPGINAYSFLELLNQNLKDPSTGIDVFAVCDFCAKHNVDAIDITSYFFPGYPNPPEETYLHRIKRYAHDL